MKRRIKSRPQTHLTKWSVVILGQFPSGKPRHQVMDYDIQTEAEAELAKAQAKGERGFVQPPLKASVVTVVADLAKQGERDPDRLRRAVLILLNAKEKSPTSNPKSSFLDEPSTSAKLDLIRRIRSFVGSTVEVARRKINPRLKSA
jgi:hypothetical protein